MTWKNFGARRRSYPALSGPRKPSIYKAQYATHAGVPSHRLPHGKSTIPGGRAFHPPPAALPTEARPVTRRPDIPIFPVFNYLPPIPLSQKQGRPASQCYSVVERTNEEHKEPSRCLSVCDWHRTARGPPAGYRKSVDFKWFTENWLCSFKKLARQDAGAAEPPARAARPPSASIFILWVAGAPAIPMRQMLRNVTQIGKKRPFVPLSKIPPAPVAGRAAADTL